MKPKIKQLKQFAKNNNLKLLPVMENLTKDKVAVKVTKNNRKHIKRTLKMFGEEFYNEEAFDYNLTESLAFMKLENRKSWWDSGYCPKTVKWRDGATRIEISHKQLRALLAKEHLKPGDFIVCKIGDTEYIVEFDSFKNNQILGKRYITIHKDGSLGSVLDNGAFDNFKRYATPEEIALLEDKPKELFVGKWYKCDDWLLMYDKDLYNCSGWFKNRYEYKYWSFDKKASEVTEATPQEVEEALIKEAKGRGFDYDDFVFEDLTNILWANYDSDIDGKEEKAIFNNGKWSEIVKPEEKQILFRVIKGNKCIKEFPAKQIQSLIKNGWQQVTQDQVNGILFPNS